MFANMKLRSDSVDPASVGMPLGITSHNYYQGDAGSGLPFRKPYCYGRPSGPIFANLASATEQNVGHGKREPGSLRCRR